MTVSPTANGAGGGRAVLIHPPIGVPGAPDDLGRDLPVPRDTG